MFAYYCAGIHANFHRAARIPCDRSVGVPALRRVLPTMCLVLGSLVGALYKDSEKRCEKQSSPGVTKLIAKMSDREATLSK
jgi:hypothetical protein